VNPNLLFQHSPIPVDGYSNISDHVMTGLSLPSEDHDTTELSVASERPDTMDEDDIDILEPMPAYVTDTASLVGIGAWIDDGPPVQHPHQPFDEALRQAEGEIRKEDELRLLDRLIIEIRNDIMEMVRQPLNACSITRATAAILEANTITGRARTPATTERR
jgi:hypothetical protein